MPLKLIIFTFLLIFISCSSCTTKRQKEIILKNFYLDYFGTENYRLTFQNGEEIKKVFSGQKIFLKVIFFDGNKLIDSSAYFSKEEKDTSLVIDAESICRKYNEKTHEYGERIDFWNVYDLFYDAIIYIKE